MRRIKAIVSGRVQGVCYRASTEATALELGLTGYVQNLPSGQVEYLAEGKADAIAALIEWSKQGPEFARVSEVNITDLEGEAVYKIFSVNY